jgi:hypothetical protein
MENLPLTFEKLRLITDLAQRGREETLYRTLRSDFVPPFQIYQQLERDITDSIFRQEKKTQFSYEVNYYYRIFETFGRKDVYSAIVDAALEYRDAHFPTAALEIDELDGKSCKILFHFNLPWLSDQTNSHLPSA